MLRGASPLPFWMPVELLALHALPLGSPAAAQAQLVLSEAFSEVFFSEVFFAEVEVLDLDFVSLLMFVLCEPSRFSGSSGLKK